jgi:superfamily II DNA or RNA helicase
MQRLHTNATDAAPLLVVATGPYVGEGPDCPRLDALFLAAPIAFKGRVVQYAGRILCTWPGKELAEVHDYVDEPVPVLASSLPKRMKATVRSDLSDRRDVIRKCSIVQRWLARRIVS